MRFFTRVFGGMAPRVADRLLAESQASHAANLKPISGNLEGFGAAVELAELPAGTWRRAVRLYRPGLDTFVWWLSTDVEADVVQSPIANDAFGRVYYSASGAGLQLTTLDAIDADPAAPASTALGVARPTDAPAVSATGGVSSSSDTRAYVYTWVTQYGEIGPPSPATIVTGKPDDTWSVAPPLAAPANATEIKIWRSSAGTTSAGDYYLVGTIAVGTASLTDTVSPANIALQLPLASETHDPPVAGLEGLTLHSSGALAAFKGRDVYLSAPWLPHAWPPEQKYTVPDEVVGLGLVGNTLTVLTKGRPAALSGSTPDAMSLYVFPDLEPCLAKRSIVAVAGAVLYASPNGLFAIDGTQLVNVTNEICTRDQWDEFADAGMVAARYGPWYVAYRDADQGWVLALPPMEKPTLVRLDRHSGVTGLETDRRTGELHLVQTDTVRQFDAEEDQRLDASWRSRQLIAPRPINFGALQCHFRRPPRTASQQAILDAALAWNTARVAAGPLDPLGGTVLGDAAPVPAGVPAPDPILGVPPEGPMGGEPLFDLATLLAGLRVRITLIGDGVVRWSGTLLNERVRKLPSGYKATSWYVELSSNAVVEQVCVAETGKELHDA